MAGIAVSSAALITLKALANSSPGFALKPWDEMHLFHGSATLKGLRRGSPLGKQSQLLQSCEKSLEHFLNPGLQQPWARVRQRFQR